MTKISLSGGEEFFTRKYTDPKTCTYYVYNCCYAEDSSISLIQKPLKQWVQREL